MKKIIYAVFTVAILIASTSCSDADLDPHLGQSKDFGSNINTEEDVKGLMNGAYNRVSSSNYYGRNYIIINEVRSDNAYSNANSNRFVAVAEMDLLPQSGEPSSSWSQIYSVIGSANIVIAATDIEGDAATINHFKGEAYALRAMGHFDLVRLYGQQHVSGGTSPGGVPYITTFGDEANFFPTRNTVADVQTKVIADLDMALSLMSDANNDASKQTLTTHAVNALKARVALYFGDMATAATASKAVIDSGAFQIASAGDFVGTWLVDSAPNSIFEIAVTATDNNGINGLTNIYQGTAYGDIAILQDLVDTFEAGDVRASAAMIDTDANGFIRNLGKYPSFGSFDDNISVIRYEEMILTYAEAIMATNPGDALTYLNMIPANRGASAYGAVTMDNILLERRKELAFEGNRFHDLARTGQAIPLVDALNQTHGGPAYGSFNFAFPIPASEVDVNSNVSQNLGW